MLNKILIEGKKSDNLQNTTKILLLLFILITFFSIFLAYKTKDADVFYVNKKDDVLLGQAHTLNQPSKKNLDMIINNVDQAIFETMNFDSYNYDDKILNALNTWYTENGFNQILNQLVNQKIMNQDYSIIDIVKRDKLTAQTYVYPGTTIVEAKRIAGKLAWNVAGNILITYRNSYGRVISNQEKAFSVWVLERDSSIYPKGIGIDSFRTF